MTLQPSLRPLMVAGRPDAPNTLDIFLDFVCPYSAKMARTIDTLVKPKFSPGGEYDGKVKLLFRLQVQPWHSASTLTHEAALAVARVSPENFWKFSLALFEHQDEYFDIPTSHLTPLQIREKLAKLAATIIPADKVEQFKDLLALKSSPNGGVAVTDDLKYNIKYARQNGIHVSPTCLWDGLVANEISSGWGEKEWSEFLKNKIAI
ncbi:thioredoxin-like protein [Crucibulum laeve]|uniref:Thioredoxin-like protein n=1 Tax=Crucibulum laeve TaxID=68775 RepID=A0A5C3MIY8_9AGAR|nr:thioredoxin-like protein [Crucibulum laeve]